MYNNNNYYLLRQLTPFIIQHFFLFLLFSSSRFPCQIRAQYSIYFIYFLIQFKKTAQKIFNCSFSFKNNFCCPSSRTIH
uniref:Uncharacterized protein n=1 Tax=Meloidogyne enterolobii TaxID=390850 RepID=A0A6V7W534_MELEN|nr:unnamed protein product [Meloidogyne enterolobii]